MRVLIVDDSVELRTIIKSVLEAVGCIVDEAKDGLEGLARFLVCEPDVIVTDINMPVMDGLTFVERLREEPQGRLKPILVLSSQSCPQKKARARRSGVQLWMDKPVDFAALAVAVARAAG
jgi:two-component system chemotaxis response regulator CheY